jgi:predicted DNA-binding WGR domain protein
MQKRRFELVNEKVSKFWEVWTENNVLLTRYGKIGTPGILTSNAYTQLLSIAFGWTDKIRLAEDGAEKLIKKYLKKGYVEV